MKIAVTGSTGQLGQILVSKLKEKVPHVNIVALARSLDKAASLGVETRVADYDHPETLETALAGIDTLMLISANDFEKRAEQHHYIIAAAKKAGIKWIVYTSIIHADELTIGLAAHHRITEAELKDTGIPFTILRNGWYTENYAGSMQAALNAGSIIGSSGEGKISAAPRADYAEAAVTVLTSTGHEGKVYELAGDESFTLSDLATEMSTQTGKTISYVDLPEQQYASTLISFGFPELYANAFAEWDVAASRNELFDDSRGLSKLIGRPTTPLSETVAEVLKGVA